MHGANMKTYVHWWLLCSISLRRLWSTRISNDSNPLTFFKWFTRY